MDPSLALSFSSGRLGMNDAGQTTGIHMESGKITFNRILRTLSAGYGQFEADASLHVFAADSSWFAAIIRALKGIFSEAWGSHTVSPTQYRTPPTLIILGSVWEMLLVSSGCIFFSKGIQFGKDKSLIKAMNTIILLFFIVFLGMAFFRKTAEG